MRSEVKAGFVRFPIDDPRFKDSREGGTFIRLVVVEPEDGVWMPCPSGRQHVVYGGQYVGDDLRDRPEATNEAWPGIEALQALTLANERYDEFHFPHLYDGFDEYRQLSRPYLAALTIGAVERSFVSDSDYWRCQYEDLTAQGKALYELIRSLYRGCEIYLQTWLDTEFEV